MKTKQSILQRINDLEILSKSYLEQEKDHFYLFIQDEIMDLSEEIADLEEGLPIQTPTPKK